MPKILKALTNKLPDIPSASFGWRFFPSDNKLQKLRRLYPIRYFSNYPMPIRFSAILLLQFYWYCRSIYLALRFCKKFGKEAKEICGKSKASQLKELIGFSLFCSVMPREYYLFELFCAENRLKADHYFYRSDFTRIIQLEAVRGSREDQIVNDKMAFKEFCQENELPSAENYAFFPKGEENKIAEKMTSIKAGSFVVKASLGCQGKGVYIFEAKKNGYIINGEKQTLSEAFSKVATLVKKGDYLIEERLQNHRDLEKISNGALVSLRIITLLDKKGRAEYLAAIAQLPFGAHHTSNYGLVALIDESSGKLGAAKRLRAISPWIPKHPATGNSISGIEIPWWQDILEIAINAHHKLGKHTSLGWDFAITDKGPVLLEANGFWDSGIIQRTTNKPLGETRFPELILERLG